uniref:Uncharacterized protein n=1 Tax=Kalanchoe fedtschenkoi TaxID=63787 RepID=A0A7N0T9U8_KALFE
MDSVTPDLSTQTQAKYTEIDAAASSVSTAADSEHNKESLVHEPASNSSPAIQDPRDLQPAATSDQSPSSESAGVLSLARLTSRLGLKLPLGNSASDSAAEDGPTTPQGGVLELFTKGIVDSSKNAVKAVQVRARHAVSQNKRRYQEGGFDLDLTYITENVIAMGFPAGDMSSGFFFGYVEGFYRNHMEEVIKFFETHHMGKYKVYNLCSERLYDSALFGGKVACFPFDDHNCPPIHMITSFCQSAYSWLKQDIENVVVVHCKAGMARTGLMICSLLLYLKFFPTSEEVIDYYNQKRCVDGKGLVLPSQIRYVKYFERILKDHSGENSPPRRCMLRGFRLHQCPYWIRPAITISDHNGVLFSTKKHPKTKDLMPEDFWIRAPKKGIAVFALPGEPGLTELAGDFKIHFQDRQGDFYCWLNTSMMENRHTLDLSDLDGFDKRKLPSPGFQVEIVMVNYNGTIPIKSSNKASDGSSNNPPLQKNETPFTSNNKKTPAGQDKDDVFSDSDGDVTPRTKTPQASSPSRMRPEQFETARAAEQQSTTHNEPNQTNTGKSEPQMETPAAVSDFKPIAADASVFTFGDDEDFDSE